MEMYELFLTEMKLGNPGCALCTVYLFPDWSS